MKGFILNTTDKVIYGAINNKLTHLMISNKEGHYQIHFGGFDGKYKFYTWYCKILCIGDSIMLKYDHIDESIISEPIITHNVNDKESEDELLLTSYYKLKQELLDDGLLSL